MILRKTALVEVENNQLELRAAQSTDGHFALDTERLFGFLKQLGYWGSWPGSGVLLSPACHCWVGLQEGSGVWGVLGRGGEAAAAAQVWLLSSTNLRLLSTIQQLPRPAGKPKPCWTQGRGKISTENYPQLCFHAGFDVRLFQKELCQRHPGAALAFHIWCTDLCTQSYFTLVTTSLLLHVLISFDLHCLLFYCFDTINWIVGIFRDQLEVHPFKN